MKTPKTIQIASIKGIREYEAKNNMRFTRISQTEMFTGDGKRIYICYF